jgi:SAM-dependent methyltransferase
MDPEYRKHYRELFERHWWWLARSDFIAAALRRLHLDPRQTTILDVGCGDGLFFGQLEQFGGVEGVETEDALPANSQWRNQIHCQPFDETFQPGRKYSVILMLDVLEQLGEPAAALRNVRRLLAEDGIFLATVPAFNALWTNHDILNQHLARFTKRSLSELLESAGLRISEEHYFFHWEFLAKLALRGYETLLPRPPGVPKVPSRWINRILYRLSRAEQAILGRMPVPFGSSLMVLARNSTVPEQLWPASKPVE